MPNLYIIAGCNGAGKTTASFTILPELFKCEEFINADTIAANISPSDPESVALEAGRIMLRRIDELLSSGADFAFETTLSTRSYVSFIKKAKTRRYKITLLYLWLPSPGTAIERVAVRVKKGGHNIPSNVIIRRYYRGIENSLNLYILICDKWYVVENIDANTNSIAQGVLNETKEIFNSQNWKKILKQDER